MNRGELVSDFNGLVAIRPLSGASVGPVLAVDGGMPGLRLRPPLQQ